jgi:hypothetical protein
MGAAPSGEPAAVVGLVEAYGFVGWVASAAAYGAPPPPRPPPPRRGLFQPARRRLHRASPLPPQLSPLLNTSTAARSPLPRVGVHARGTPPRARCHLLSVKVLGRRAARLVLRDHPGERAHIRGPLPRRRARGVGGGAPAACAGRRGGRRGGRGRAALRRGRRGAVAAAGGAAARGGGDGARRGVGARGGGGRVAAAARGGRGASGAARRPSRASLAPLQYPVPYLFKPWTARGRAGSRPRSLATGRKRARV